MARHEEPVRTHPPKRAVGGHRTLEGPAATPPGRCAGAAAQLAALHRTLRHAPVAQLREEGMAANRTGLPDRLKRGVEALSGLSLDAVRVHRNSAKPAQLQAHAYTQGSEIHVAPGQEQHLPHEAWHVVQQMQGRVKPTLQLKEGIPINDDAGLEHEADVMGARALQQQSAPPEQTAQREARGSAIQRMRARLRREENRDPTTQEIAATRAAAIANSRALTGHGRAAHGRRREAPSARVLEQARESERIAVDRAIQLRAKPGAGPVLEAVRDGTGGAAGVGRTVQLRLRMNVLQLTDETVARRWNAVHDIIAAWRQGRNEQLEAWTAEAEAAWNNQRQPSWQERKLEAFKNMIARAGDADKKDADAADNLGWDGMITFLENRLGASRFVGLAVQKNVRLSGGHGRGDTWSVSGKYGDLADAEIVSGTVPFGEHGRGDNARTGARASIKAALTGHNDQVDVLKALAREP